MIKYFCDMCGKNLEEWDCFTIKITVPEIRRYEGRDETYVVCKNCLKVVKNMLNTR